MLGTQNRVGPTRMQHDDVTAKPIWRTAAILKIFFWLYLNDLLSRDTVSPACCPIRAKFGMKKKNHACPHRSRDHSWYLQLSWGQNLHLHIKNRPFRMIRGPDVAIKPFSQWRASMLNF